MDRACVRWYKPDLRTLGGSKLDEWSPLGQKITLLIPLVDNLGAIGVHLVAV